jgi:hypothetical protein
LAGTGWRLFLPAFYGFSLVLEPLCFGGVESGAFGFPGGFLEKTFVLHDLAADGADAVGVGFAFLLRASASGASSRAAIIGRISVGEPDYIVVRPVSVHDKQGEDEACRRTDRIYQRSFSIRNTTIILNPSQC